MISQDNLEIFFDNDNSFLTKLTEDKMVDMEGELILPECIIVLKNMSNRKSPCLDGFTSEFYKFLWIDIQEYVIKSLNFAYENSLLSVSQKQGLITCLPKEGKPKHLLKNWRPISLLNVDYKIGSAYIAERLKTVLERLISNLQTGFLKGRYIGECTRLILDIIVRTEEEQIPGLLLLVDFEKAFDSLEWDFMFKCLNFLGFAESIIKWVKHFYTYISSCIVNNGHCS
jgi:hypothetical protein